MANILSQDEVDALLRNFQEEEETLAEEPSADELHEERAAPHSGELTVFDFRRPNRLSPAAQQFLEKLHQRYAEDVQRLLAAFIGTLVGVRCRGIEQSTYRDWVTGLPAESSLFAVRIESGESAAVLGLDAELALAIVDRMLGGRRSTKVPSRSLTRLERALTARLLGELVEQLTACWASEAPLVATFDSAAADPRERPPLPPAEGVVRVEMAFEDDRISGRLTLCYPYSALDPLLEQALAAREGQPIQRLRAPEAPAWLRAGLDRARLPVRVRLGRGTVRIGEFIRLRPGDVIRLETALEQPVVVEVGGRAKFVGRAGRAGRRLAVQLIGTPARTQGGENHDG